MRALRWPERAQRILEWPGRWGRLRPGDHHRLQRRRDYRRPYAARPCGAV